MSISLDNLPSVSGVYRIDTKLSNYCWFQVGGNADLLFKPTDSDDLSLFLQQYNNATPIFVLGVGSNLLINDNGFKGCVIRLGRGFNYVRSEGNRIICGAACLDVNIAKFALEKNLGGLEFLSGVPGTIGGALAMNAGAYGKEISDVFINATAIDKNGVKKVFNLDEMGFNYRQNGLTSDWIFTEATLQAQTDDPVKIKARMDHINTQRQETQPIKSRTSGSTFRNPDGFKAWQLIDAAGCRGLQIGGAQVSEMHCNFFLNVGGATAQDIMDLIAMVKKKVYDHSGVILHEEIKII